MEESAFTYHYQPPQPGNKKLLLLLHGTGGDERSLLPLAAMIDPDAAILAPRGKVLEGNAPRFFRRFGEGNLDLDDLRFRSDELAEWVHTKQKELGLEQSKVVAVGYSNGANVATTLLYRHPKLLSGAAILHGMLPYTPEPMPRLPEIPVLLTAGEQDPIVPASHVRDLNSVLSRSGAMVGVYRHPGGHQLVKPEIDAVKRWYDGRFGGQPVVE